MPVYTDVYTVDGSKILSEQRTDEETGNVIRTIYYVCDANGQPVGMKYNGVQYWYRKNMQGDVVRILNASGAEVVSYAYDAWGKVLSVSGSLSSTVGAANPFRYRGYYYDTETGWYYLNTRYYDPNVGRFLSPDTILGANGGLLGYNLYAYCNNNPVMFSDPSGMFFDTIFDIITFGASIIDVISHPDDPLAWAGLAGDAIDLIPFVTGVGETTRVVKNTARIVDDTVDIAKTVDKIDDSVDVVKDGIKYTDKVLKQMDNTNDLRHAFPSIVDTMIDFSAGKPLKGGDGVIRNLIELPGTINEKTEFLNL